MVHSRTYDFLQTNNIFNENQYGFRTKHSTTNAATSLSIDVGNALEKSISVLCVFLDLSKVFHTTDHQILLHKLDFYWIRGPPLKWFKSYLTNWKQYVSCNDSTSLPRCITSGVPDMSILGPLLFMLYTNDLPLCLNKSKSILYADDTTVYMSGKLINDLYKMNKNMK